MILEEMVGLMGMRSNDIMTNGLRTPFGIIPIRVLREMLEPLRERENRILELENEVKRLKQQLNS
tara:strand:- start:1471 stop:1665 length:195 start_codon:yes stop_codon:yes gene_type:complete